MLSDLVTRVTVTTLTESSTESGAQLPHLINAKK